nr:hypothetical protein BaRGS_011967 [Batillaria attramentaria]
MESVLSDHQTDAPTHEDDVDEEISHNEAMDFSTLTLGSDDEAEASGNVSATPAPNIRMMRAVKSAPIGTTRFARTHEYVADAMKYLQLAVEFSCGENTRAIYDLALMHQALGEFKEALNLLADIRGKRLLRSPLDEICALEQEGIILREMAEKEEDEAKRGQLEGEAKSMFDAALTAASEQYSNNPDTRAFIGYIWQSFSVLHELSQNSDQSNETKMEEKARLNHLVKRHNQLIVLKQELEKLAEEENSKVMLQIHISTLVHQEHYAQALKSAQLLQCKAEGNPKDNMSIDEQYVQMLRLSVCRQALLQQSALPTSTLSTHYFHEAFVEALVSPKDPTSASEATFDTDSGKDDMVFDVMLLYEDEAQGEAAVLRDVLRQACGLDVKWMEDAPPNKPEHGGVLEIMYRCRLVVVVLVKGRGLSRALGLYLNQAAGKRTTVTLLLKDNCHLPKLLKTHRSRSCPAELLQPNVGRRGQYEESTRYAIWELFCFLIGCEPDFRLPEIN